ncbi:MAG TPA: hypothetical protein VGN88_12605, partial [Phycisphaerae bacterium]
DEKDMEELAQRIAQKPDMTLAELVAVLSKKVSITTVHRATKRLRLTLKKSLSMPPSRIARTSRRHGRNGPRPSRMWD